MVVAQFVEQSLPIPEVRGSNPVIGKFIYIEHLFTVHCELKRRDKGKEAGNGPFFLKKIVVLFKDVAEDATHDMKIF